MKCIRSWIGSGMERDIFSTKLCFVQIKSDLEAGHELVLHQLLFFGSFWFQLDGIGGIERAENKG